MRKLALVVIALATTQLTACVVAHRDYGYRNYRSQYHSPYPESYGYNNGYNNGYSNGNGNGYDQYQNDYNNDVAQIVGMRQVKIRQEGNNEGGALAGAIIGGIVGNQIARGDDHSSSEYRNRGRGWEERHSRQYESAGDGRAVATIGGAIIGSLIGSQVGKSSEQRVVTELSLRMSNGQIQTTLVNNNGQFRVGDQVRVQMQNGRWVVM